MTRGNIALIRDGDGRGGRGAGGGDERVGARSGRGTDERGRDSQRAFSTAAKGAASGKDVRVR